MNKGLLVLWVLSILCLLLQIFPVISVPLTNPNHNIYLSTYRNYTFGVFGICDLQTGVCSDPRIGYPSINSTFYYLADDNDYNVGGVQLPSSATYTISKLLVVHVIAFCVSCLLVLLMLFLNFLDYLDMRRLKQLRKLQSDDFSLQSLNRQEEPQPKPPQKRDITPYINWMLALSIISFISTLLAFLADLLLFIPNLSYIGWIQLFPIIVLCIIATMLCFMKRAITSRRYLQDRHEYENDDMRTRRHIVEEDRWDDSASDDGFLVYTNGLHTTNRKPDDNAYIHELSRPSEASNPPELDRDNMTPFHNNENLSINSHHS